MPKTRQLTVRRPTSRGGCKRVEATPAGLEVIEAMAAEGNDQRTIAKALGIDQKTLMGLRERDLAVAEAWERGHAALADELTHHLLSAARNGNIVAMIYLTKARLGWREGHPAEGAKQAVQVNIQIPPPMSDAEFKAILDGRADPLPEPTALPAPRERVVR